MGRFLSPGIDNPACWPTQTHTQTKVDIKKGESRNKANTGLANPMRTRDASLSCQPVYPAPSYAAGYIKGLRGLKLMLASRKGLKGTG